MTIQAVFLGVLVPVFLGAVFHLWRGGAAWRLGLYVVLAEIGFWLAHFLGNRQEWEFLKVGSLQLGAGLIGALLFMGLGYWLSFKQPEPAAPRPKRPATRSVRK